MFPITKEITYKSVGPVSYNDDIVPILERNCVSCHHDGAIAPWSMSSHAMVMGWSPMMKEVVMTKRMPPGQIDPHVGMPIKDVAGLTISERQKLIQWIFISMFLLVPKSMKFCGIILIPLRHTAIQI